MSSIQQKRFTECISAECLADAVRYIRRTPASRTEYRVRYEHLLREPFEFSAAPETNLTVLASFVTLGLVFLLFVFDAEAPRGMRVASFAMSMLFLSIGALLWILGRWPRRQIQLSLWSRQQVVQLSRGASPLVLYVDRPDRLAVASFFEALRVRAAAYMRQKYGSADFDDSKEGQVERLRTLKERGAISEDEFDALRLEVQCGP